MAELAHEVAHKGQALFLFRGVGLVRGRIVRVREAGPAEPIIHTTIGKKFGNETENLVCPPFHKTNFEGRDRSDLIASKPLGRSMWPPGTLKRANEGVVPTASSVAAPPSGAWSAMSSDSGFAFEGRESAVIVRSGMNDAINHGSCRPIESRNVCKTMHEIGQANRPATTILHGPLRLSLSLAFFLFSSSWWLPTSCCTLQKDDCAQQQAGRRLLRRLRSFHDELALNRPHSPTHELNRDGTQTAPRIVRI